MEAVVVGIDGSSGSHHALQWAAAIAIRAGCELVAVRALERASESGTEAEAAAEIETEKWIAALPSRCERRVEVRTGAAAVALAEAASHSRAGLLAVGVRGAGGFAGLHLGSVVHHLTLHAGVPLAVVPPSAILGCWRLVVGADGSEGGARAVRFTAELALSLRVPVTAVYAAEPRVSFPEGTTWESWKHVVERDVRAWIRPIEEVGVPVDVRVDDDPEVHPVASLEYALEGRAGSVAVLGTRGGGGFPGMLVGSVPLELVHHTAHAVILVPGAAG